MSIREDISSREGHSHTWVYSKDAFCDWCGVSLKNNCEREHLTLGDQREDISWYAFCDNDCLDRWSTEWDNNNKW